MNGEAGHRGVWRRRLVIAVIAALLLPAAWELLLSVRWTFHLSEQDIRPDERQALIHLGVSALDGKDVPVAAVLMFGDSIVGRGFNTVVAGGNAGGHAEMNAISDALHRLGDAGFASLNRDSLELLSTFEPCTMCTGALMNFGIKRVAFLKTKPFFHRLQEDFRLLLYRFRMEQRGPAALQDSLFNLSWSRRR